MTLPDLTSIYAFFSEERDPRERYQKIISLGRELPPFPSEWATEAYRVPGCQSVTYVHVEVKEGKIVVAAASEALISAGLAALMIYAYQGSAPEFLLKTPPRFLQELGILDSITPTRINGIMSFYTKMKEELLSLLRE